MIKQFHIGDLLAFTPNRYSDPEVMMYALKDPLWLNFTFWDANRVEAILCAREYTEGCFQVAILISENFRVKNAAVIRDFLREACGKTKVIRIQTDSPNVPVLNAWHEYMGFTLEGIRRKYMGTEDFAMWGIVFEE